MVDYCFIGPISQTPIPHMIQMNEAVQSSQAGTLLLCVFYSVPVSTASPPTQELSTVHLYSVVHGVPRKFSHHIQPQLART